MLNGTRLLACLVLAGLIAGYSLTAATQPTVAPDQPKAEKPTETPKKPTTAAPKPPTHKVEKGPFKVEVTLKGVFEAEHMAELSISPEAWGPQAGGGPLVLKKVVEHGTAVRQGDPVLWIDTEKIDQTIRDLETDRRLTEVAIRLAEEELPILEKAMPQELAAAERARRFADEDLKKFLEQDRALMEKIANFQVKRANDWVEYEREELRQLEKMYRSKDLTEETEEIILKRQRNYLEAAIFYLKLAEIYRDETIKIDLPRRDLMLRENADKTALALDKARTTLPLQLNQKRLALEKLKYERDKAGERLAKLKRDREALTIKSPTDGIVYHGRCVRGQWPAGASDRLRRGGMVQPDEVLLTVVQTKPLFVRAEVEEKDLHHLHDGLKGKLTPTTAPDARLTARVEKVSLVPVGPGKFDARFAVEVGDGAPTLMPGMGCSIKFIPYLKEQAISVPASAVFTDDLDDEKHYVLLPGKDGKPIRRPVVVGKKSDRKVEIVEGLQEGEEILLEKPGEGRRADLPLPLPALGKE